MKPMREKLWDPVDVDSIAIEDVGEGQVIDGGEERIQEALDLLARVSPREADILDLSLRGVQQPVIAELLCEEGGTPVTQGAISHQLKRATARLRYLVWIDSLGLDSQTIQEALDEAGMRPSWSRMVAHLWTTSSTLGTARQLGHQQSTVHDALRRAQRLAADGRIKGPVGEWLKGFVPRMLLDQRRSEEMRAAVRDWKGRRGRPKS